MQETQLCAQRCQLLMIFCSASLECWSHLALNVTWMRACTRSHTHAKQTVTNTLCTPPLAQFKHKKQTLRWLTFKSKTGQNVLVKSLNTFPTTGQDPRSSRLCSCRLQNEALVPRTLLSLSWKTQPNWNWFQNKLPSDARRELYHFLLHCFDVEIRENMMASKRNIISFLKHWIDTFHGWQQA